MSSAALARRFTSLDGVWYLPSWDLDGEVCRGSPVRLGPRASTPLLYQEHSLPLSPVKGSCPESLIDFSSIPSASLDVFTLALGGFPIFLVRNIHSDQRSLPSSSTLGDRVGVASDSITLSPGVDLKKPAHSLPAPLQGSQGAKGGTSPYNPGGGC